MWAVIIGILFAGGLVKFAYGQKEEPTLKPALRRTKLIRLARIPSDRLTLDQAEDGMVLAREFDAPALEKRFAAVVVKLKVLRNKGLPTQGRQP
jgi:hypothetical protein